MFDEIPNKYLRIFVRLVVLVVGDFGAFSDGPLDCILLDGLVTTLGVRLAGCGEQCPSGDEWAECHERSDEIGPSVWGLADPLLDACDDVCR